MNNRFNAGLLWSFDSNTAGVLGDYVFLALELVPDDSGDEPRDLFLAIANQLLSTSQSLQDRPDLYHHSADQRAMMVGWFRRLTGEYAYTQILVSRSTNSNDGWGTVTEVNDGKVFNVSGWVQVEWVSSSGQTIYLHYANVEPEATLRFSVSTTGFSGQSYTYTAGVSVPVG